MENKRFFTATDVQEMLGVSLSYAYKLIRKLNAEQFVIGGMNLLEKFMEWIGEKVRDVGRGR